MLLGLMALVASVVVAGGCTADSTNPDFPAVGAVVDVEWEKMGEKPVGLARPLVVLGGYHAPEGFAGGVAARLARLTGAKEDEVLAVGFMFCDDFAEVSNAVVEAVEARWPSGSTEGTIEVDVVGISMGGLAARAAAMRWPVGDGAADGEKVRPVKRLRIARLFTLATPHRGAALADVVAMDSLARDMKSGSAFLRSLDDGLAGGGYELVCYARTRDDIVGARNTAPPGCEPIWVEGPLLFSHHFIQQDRRIMLDIARRLRGEAPIAVRGSVPPRD